MCIQYILYLALSVAPMRRNVSSELIPSNTTTSYSLFELPFSFENKFMRF